MSRNRFFVIRETNSPNPTVEQFARRSDAIDSAALWVQSPLRTGPRTATVIRRGPPDTTNSTVLADFESPR